MTIHIRNWEKFQHADTTKRGRAPVWIKLYTELLSDEAFLSLTEHRRLVLICLWIEYARTRARLPLDTRSLTRRLQLRVTKADLDALRDTGFIEITPIAARHPLDTRSTPGGDNDTESLTTAPLDKTKDKSANRQVSVTPQSSLDKRRQEGTSTSNAPRPRVPGWDGPRSDGAVAELFEFRRQA